MELNNIKEYIKTHELDTPSRKRDKVFSRFVLYNHLVNKLDKGTQYTGEMFGRDHSTVVYGLK